MVSVRGPLKGQLRCAALLQIEETRGGGHTTTTDRLSVGEGLIPQLAHEFSDISKIPWTLRLLKSIRDLNQLGPPI